MIQCLKLLVTYFFIFPSWRFSKTEGSKLSNSLRLHSFERADELVMFTMWAHVTAELMKTNALEAAGSSCGQQTTQGACVSNRAVQDRGRRLNQSHFRSMAEVSFLPSANTRKRASASREQKGYTTMLKSTAKDDYHICCISQENSGTFQCQDSYLAVPERICQ